MDNTSWVDHSESFGDTVRQMREARGWTRADLLRELDKIGYCMHATVLARIEKATESLGLPKPSQSHNYSEQLLRK